MSIVAVVPLKRLDEGKQRLSPCLPARARAQLSLAMAADVLTALRGAPAVAETWLVCDDNRAAALAIAHGARWLSEHELGGSGDLNAVAAAATACCQREGHAGLLLAHADLPALRAADVEALADSWRRLGGGKRLLLAPSHDGGTSLMLLTPTPGFPFRYGPGSAQRHRLAAEAAGYRVVVEPHAWAVRDVDTPADLAATTTAAAQGRCGIRTGLFLRRGEAIGTV